MNRRRLDLERGDDEMSGAACLHSDTSINVQPGLRQQLSSVLRPETCPDSESLLGYNQKVHKPAG